MLNKLNAHLASKNLGHNQAPDAKATKQASLESDLSEENLSQVDQEKSPNSLMNGLKKFNKLCRHNSDSNLRAQIHQEAKQADQLQHSSSTNNLIDSLSVNNLSLSHKRALQTSCPKLSAKELEAREGQEDQDVDSGYAWVILAVMFLINASTFGTARAYGLIFEKLARQSQEGRTIAALPFTIMGAVENMGGPLSGYLLARFNWRRTVFVGCCLITLAHLLSAVVDSLIGRILTMGLMCGLGLSLVVVSSFQINNAYFVKYRARAFGFGLTGAAVGTFYISPICQYILDNYGTNVCYFILGLILFPNVLLALLLKTKKSRENVTIIQERLQASDNLSSSHLSLQSISSRLCKKRAEVPLWSGVKNVIKTPIFHLIWPTQAIFCWLNFVYGMIIVDFGKDRGLSKEQGSHLILFWAFGQLIGRLILGSLIDLKLTSYRCFTIICFLFITLATWILNNIRVESYNAIIIPLMVFILSMFISAIYILFNNLTVQYMEKSIRVLSIGISSFIGSFSLLPRASVIGYYRDTIGNYDSMLNMFAYTSFAAAFIWLIIPTLIEKMKSFYYATIERKQQMMINQNTAATIQSYDTNCNSLQINLTDEDSKTTCILNNH